ncbi:secretory pathway protein Sec39-domain-containing protein [Ampelomyces quisqualis]|uniref:Secretory pathway protein Sec39-domain-containing protein n=1 Tax=Ampelomyces quisqualis TaxID=50730 RepID=A0A6A5QTS3_AMPQU|nr:secretory pathway protein Sec39-domain-containing protein [Ampelomyces quisqualis]
MSQTVSGSAVTKTDCNNTTKTTDETTAKKTTTPYFLFLLSPTIPLPCHIQIMARLRHPPPVHSTGNSSQRFAVVDLATRNIIRRFLGQRKGVFIALPAPSEKELDHIEALGGRLMTIPKQNQWPAKYFLYGGLAEEEKLREVLGVEEMAEMRDAVVCGGEIRMWGEREALVDAGRGDMVKGKMYVVASKEEEDKLREYQGEGYEVCRLTSKYASPPPHLTATHDAHASAHPRRRPMSPSPTLRALSGPHCVLLAVHHAAAANIAALRALTAQRAAELPLELVLRVLLTYLPEELEPPLYIDFLRELATGAPSAGDGPPPAVDTAGVEQLSTARATKRRRALELLPVVHPLYAAEAALDAFSHFLVHRAHRIDAQTGLLDRVPALVVPFLAHGEYLRTWFISTALPLLRLSYEYYPQRATGALLDFARLHGTPALDCQLGPARRDATHVARDLRAVVAPWLCGAPQRRRRRPSSDEPDDWACLFRWLLHASTDSLPVVATAICEWDGPADMDLGGYEQGRDYVGDHHQPRLEMLYAQTALACLCLIDQSDTPALDTAHALLARVCHFLDCEPPPALAVGIASLPSYDLDDAVLPAAAAAAASLLQEHRLLEPDNPMTTPGRRSIHIMTLILFSACALSSMQHPVSVRHVAKMFLQDDRHEQLSLLHTVLHGLSSSRKDSAQWTNTRLKLLWLWNWGTDIHDADRNAQGILGALQGSTVETEILKALVESCHYPLVLQTYIKPAAGLQPLPIHDVEHVILTCIMHHYDNASNGNRTRGGMKRAAEIFAAFAPHFPQSSRFQRIQALLSATHAMSFYSLILHHGVPFQPVDIRASSNPLALIQKLLSQNLASYTKLDDLISIGQNLVMSMPSTIMNDDHPQLDASIVERNKASAERRVVGMAIDAALEEDDFETAYSYVVNRLSPAAPSPTPSLSSQRFSFGSVETDEQEDDAEDVAWRAALRAGRFNASKTQSSSWSQSAPRPDLRRLEQRMELLSQALLLAPPNRLEEVLTVWQQCEAEMTALLAEETEAEERFNDAADKKLPGTFINETITVQPRREVGRGAVEEAPMGLFDVARGAAAAFSKSAFPLRGSAQAASETAQTGGNTSSRASIDLSDSGSMGGNDDRLRKRDMVASAATGALASGTGALASGLGWMLGKYISQSTKMDSGSNNGQERNQYTSKSASEALRTMSCSSDIPVVHQLTRMTKFHLTTALIYLDKLALSSTLSLAKQLLKSIHQC